MEEIVRVKWVLGGALISVIVMALLDSFLVFFQVGQFVNFAFVRHNLLKIIYETCKALSGRINQI